MTTERFMRHVLTGSVACAFSPYAAAQAINYQVLNSTPVPTLGTAGLAVLSILIVGGAIYFHRQARSQSAKLLSLMVGLIGLGVVATKHEVIQEAWATLSPREFTAGSTVVVLPGTGIFEVVNNSGAPIRITGFDVSSCNSINFTQRQEKIHLAALDMPLSDLGIKLAGTSSGTWSYCAYGVPGCSDPAPTPPAIGCAIGSQVQPSLSCFVTVKCDGVPG